MKNLKLITTMSVVLMLLITLSCSVENNPISESDAAYDFQTEVPNQTRAANEDKVLIEWHEGVTEARKVEVRDHYKNKKAVVKVEVCDDIFFETWTLNCKVAACRATDTPVDTDDDVKRIFMHLTCEEL